MKNSYWVIILFLLLPAFSIAQFSTSEKAAYQQQAKAVTIIRDNWGIPHVYGKTDADAVFGLMYAECEDNFAAVEKNYLGYLGRMSEIEGRSQLYQDLQMRLLYDSTDAIRDYEQSPPWLKKLCVAFAAGVNYYMVLHPAQKSLAVKRFLPWYPFMSTDGGIASTETGGLRISDVIELYGKKEDNKTAFAEPLIDPFKTDPLGSNGFAVGPSKTASGSAIIYINPHVTFYYRTEAQIQSEEGLSAYGAATWGQFFIYQGFNQHCGWMHTTGYSDVADLYKEEITKKAAGFTYKYDGKQLPVKQRSISINYKENGVWKRETFTTYATQHGPVVGIRDSKWISLKVVNHSLKGMMQSWLRIKTGGFDDFKKVMELRTNISNNTVFADDKGNIAYWHGNAVARRDTAFDYSRPVDGSTSKSDWKSLYAVDSTIHIYNPKNGYVQSCNATPFAVSGPESPKQENYPIYMAPDGQSPRSITAIRLLTAASKLTVDSFIHTIGYSRYLSGFDILLPSLFDAYSNLPQDDELVLQLKEPISILKSWDKNAAINSVATTLATEWADRLANEPRPPHGPYYASHVVEQLQEMTAVVPARRQLELLKATMTSFTQNFGTWKLPWGEFNRYQRTVDGKLSDSLPSLPVVSASSGWGCIPSFGNRYFPGTKKKYGYNGNSFVACVEFGSRLKAKTIVTGGESFDPSSPHFADQAQRYIDGNFKDVLFYKEDVLKHVERQYHPGE